MRSGVALFAGKVGFGPTELAALVHGASSAPCWTDAEQALIATVDDLVSPEPASDADVRLVHDEEWVAKLRTGEDTLESDGQWSPQINIGTSVLIPETYVEDLQVRLGLYRRVAELITDTEVQAFGAELIDRFGPLPDAVEHLLQIVTIPHGSADIDQQVADEVGLHFILLDRQPITLVVQPPVDVTRVIADDVVAMSCEFHCETRQRRLVSPRQVANDQSARFHRSISDTAEDFGIQIS